MGLWDAIKGVSDDFGKLQDKKRIKREILDRFDMASLKKISKHYGIGEPSKFSEDPFTGKKTRRAVTRDHFIDLVYSQLKFDQITAFCEKNRIQIQDLLNQLSVAVPQAPTKPTAIAPARVAAPTSSALRESRPAGPTMDFVALPPSPAAKAPGPSIKPLPPRSTTREFDELLSFIRKMKPEPTRDERELEGQLVMHLKHGYAEARIGRQVKGDRNRVDVVVDGKFAIEIKVADSRTTLRNAVAQVIAYRKQYSNLVVVLLDVHELSREEIDASAAEYRTYGASTIILDEKVKRKGSQ